MVSCNLLDFRCIFVNELFGSIALTLLAAAIGFLIISGKLRFGFETSISLSIVGVLLASLAIGGFAVIYAFITLVVAILIAITFNRIIGN